MRKQRWWLGGTLALLALSCSTVSTPRRSSAPVDVRVVALTGSLGVAVEVSNSGQEPAFVLDPAHARGRMLEDNCSIAIDDDLMRLELVPGHFAPSFVRIAPGEKQVFEWGPGLIGMRRCSRVRVAVNLVAFAADPSPALVGKTDTEQFAYLREKQSLVSALPTELAVPGD